MAQAGIPIVKEFEGCRLKAYQDVTGKWTIGYGDTQNVAKGLVITQEEADERLANRYAEIEGYVRALVKVPVTDNQLGALVSFAYNLGPGNLAGSTLLKLLNTGTSKAKVALEFPKWNKAGGKVVSGLVRRRAAEQELFLS